MSPNTLNFIIAHKSQLSQYVAGFAKTIPNHTRNKPCTRKSISPHKFFWKKAPSMHKNLIQFYCTRRSGPIHARLREWFLWKAPVGEPWTETAAIAPWASPWYGRCLVATSGCHSYSKISVWRFILLPPHPCSPPILLPLQLHPPLLFWPNINAHLKIVHQPLTSLAIWK